MPAATSALWALLATAPAGPPPMIPSPAVAGVQPRTYRPLHTHERVVVDGRADDPIWSRTPRDQGFTERQPELGGAPPEKTTLRVAYDDFALYFLIECEALARDPLVRNLRRDSRNFFADDAIYIKIDPPHDHRTGYNFGVNAAGAQVDMLVLENGKVRIQEWDGVWEAEVNVGPHRMTAEFRIPFSVLGIMHAENRTIGLNVSRDSARRNATYDWRLIVPPQNPVSAATFGDLVGIGGIRPQRALELLPYGLLRTDFTDRFDADPRTIRNVAIGGEARLQIGASSYAEASLFTDFAQVEADEVQVARDRFPLFFPERRPFFVNGLDVFNFGRAEEAQLFFTRRIGLQNGRATPVIEGAKAYGRVGRVSYGLLNVQTATTLADPLRGFGETPPDNTSVARVRVQMNDVLNLGTMVLGQHRIGAADGDTFAGGLDAQMIALGGKLQWYSFAAGSHVQDPAVAATFDPVNGRELTAATAAGRRTGWTASSSLEYQGLYVRPSLLWLWSDDDFEARIGFYRRPHTARHEARMQFSPRPRVLGLRELVMGPRVNLTSTADYGRMLTAELVNEFEANWRKGFTARYELTQYTDRVVDPFVLYLYTVAPARYSGFRHAAVVSTPQRWATTAELRYEALDLFGGFAHQPSVQLTGRMGKHVTASARYTHLVGHLEDSRERFDFGYANGYVDVGITRFVTFDTLLRLDLSPGRERVGLQSRLRWRYLPGSDLYLVDRTDQPLGADAVGVEPREPFHEVTLKFTYYLRSFLPVRRWSR